MNGKIPDCEALVKTCMNFEPRVEFKIFLNGISEYVRPAMSSMAGTEACFELTRTLQQCYESVTLYNQAVKAALECLIRDINKINVLYGKVFSAI